MTGVEERLRLRVAVIGVVVLSMFVVLVARLWFLQVLAGERFAEASNRNRVRIVSVEAPRGRILDRNGTVLVRNRTALAVGIRKDDLPRDRAEALRVKRRLGKLLDMSVAEIDRRLADRRTSPYKAAVVKEDVPAPVIFTVRERQAEFRGVETLALPVRTYPKKTLAAHVLGYVGETNEAELKSLKGYRLGDSIGRAGVERSYEKWLRGTSGLEKLEVDALGRVYRSLGGRDVVPGSDLYLSIDATVQAVAERALREGIARARSQVYHRTKRHFRAPAGAAVVLDARTGEVVAMASYPTYDVRRFIGGVSEDYFEFLNDPDNHSPQFNRVIQAAYPPGSTFKPILATAALETGAGSPGGTYPCRTEFRRGDRVFRNWKARNASITITQSLVESCDTVYYNFASRWYDAEAAQARAGKKPDETMQQWSRRFGLDRPTGIDLPQEAAGRIPDRDWRREVWEANKREYCERYEKTKDRLFEDLCVRGYLWRPGDSINMSIGQGDVLTTPLQMATVYAAVANGGKVLEPHVGLKIVSPDGKTARRIEPVIRRRVKAGDSVFRYVQNALEAVAERGTGQFPFRGWPLDRIPMAAKTGSAEIGGKQPFSWFASYGPANDPKYVAVAVVEEAGFGSQVAGPVVRRIMDELFDRPPLPIVFGTRSD